MKRQFKLTLTQDFLSKFFFATIVLSSGRVLAEESKASPVDFNAKDVWDVDIYNRDDHKVLVIHDRKYTKSKKFELGLGFGTIYSNPLYNNTSYEFKAGYHLSEYWGIEGIFNRSNNWLSPEGIRLDDYFRNRQFPTGAENQALSQIYGIGATWSPIYGKFAFFRSNIVYFDIFATFGAAMLKIKSEGLNLPTSYQDQPGSLLMIGTRVFLAQSWALKIDLRNSIYKTKYTGYTIEQTGTTIPDASVWRNQTQIMLGFSYLLGKGE